LLYVGVLLLNAVAILHEERFLTRIGFGRNSQYPPPAQYDPSGAPAGSSIKNQMINAISAVRTLMR
ncbi:Yos1-like protein, partial [Caulochytrium protostelioides]